jgi:hypothetical protein
LLIFVLLFEGWQAGRQAGRLFFLDCQSIFPLVDQILAAQAAESDNPQDSKRERQTNDEIKLFFPSKGVPQLAH